jgi:hypothetical protein
MNNFIRLGVGAVLHASARRHRHARREARRCFGRSDRRAQPPRARIVVGIADRRAFRLANMQFRSRLSDFHEVVHLVPDHVGDPPNALLQCTEVGTAFAANLDRSGRLLAVRASTPTRRTAPEPGTDFSEFSSALSQNTPFPSSLLRGGEIALDQSEERSCDAHCWRWPSALSRSAG